MKKNFTIQWSLYLTLFLCFNLSLSAQEVIWGGAGIPNSEFDGGMNDWTAVGVTYPEANWVWEADGKADLGAFSGGAQAQSILSPSLANGAMVFDSDFYDNNGDPNALGLGDFPSPQEAELISPILDLSGEGRMTLRFNQYHRNFLSETYVAWSMDGGANWSELINVNNVPVNESTPRNDVKEIPLTGATGSAEFQVKFVILGDYYFWIVDDVQILKREPHNMRVNENWHAIAPNFRTPKTQVEEFGFLVDIENIGGTDETNVTLNLTVENDDTGAIAYSVDQDYGTIESDSLAENVSFGAFLPPSEEADYVATYSISFDSIDIDPSDNQLDFDFEISDSTFAKEGGKTRDIFPAASNWEAGEPHTWAYGNHYYIPNDGYATSASFIIGNANQNAGQNLFINLYQWFDLNEDGNADTDERVLFSTNIYQIQGNENAVFPITIPLFDFDFDNPPEVEAGGDYLLMAEFIAPDDLTDLELGASDALDYGAMILNSEQVGTPRYASMLGINHPLEEEAYSSLGFGRDLVPVVRLNVNETPLNAKEILSANNKISIFPNPASDMISVAIDLENVSKKVSINVFSAEGKLVRTEQFETLQKETIQLNVNDLNAGNYFLMMQTEDGYMSQKFTVQR